MRHRRTYRSDRKRRARARGITLAELDAQDARAREIAAQNFHRMAMALTPEQARMALGVWSASGGKVNVLTGEHTNAEPERYQMIIDPVERPIYDALKEPQPDNPLLEGTLGHYRGVTIHGR